MTEHRREAGFDPDEFKDSFPDDDILPPDAHDDTAHHDTEHEGHDAHAYGDITPDVAVTDEHDEVEHVVETEEDEPRQRSALSRLIIPVGVAALVGIGGLTAWQGGYLSTGDSANVVSQSPSTMSAPLSAPSMPLPPRQQAAAPLLPVQAAPTLPVVVVGMPDTTGARPAPSLTPTLPTMGQASMPPATIVQVPVMPDTRMADMLTTMNGVLAELSTYNKSRAGEASLSSDIKTMSEAIMVRFDKADTRQAGLEQRVDTASSRLAALESRLSAMETKGTRTSTSAAATPPVPSTSAPGRRGAVQDRRQVTSTASTGYRLLGASRDSALIQTPTGILQVNIGSTLPNGAVAKGFRQENGSWILNTSTGDVRP